MRKRLISLAVLLAFAFCVAAGHLPCRAEQAARETEPDVRTSCHASATPVAAPTLQDGFSASGHDCCSEEHGLCQHACHMVADMRGGAPRFSVEASTRMLPAAVDRSLPLFAHPIDHIPLA
jgi:hypothetical protein